MRAVAANPGPVDLPRMVQGATRTCGVVADALGLSRVAAGLHVELVALLLRTRRGRYGGATLAKGGQTESISGPEFRGGWAWGHCTDHAGAIHADLRGIASKTNSGTEPQISQLNLHPSHSRDGSM